MRSEVMRSEFEKNVIHKQILNHVRFSEKSNQYLPVDALSSVDRACADVANVGWISYQYQQSKIDELQTKLADSEKTRSVLYQENIDLRDKSDELQKRVDAALKLIPSLKSENDLWGCEQVERQIELLEQALNGGDE